MPIQLAVDHETKEVKTVATGPIVMEDIQNHLARERKELVRMVEILLDGVAEVRPFRKAEAVEAREWLEGRGA